MYLSYFGLERAPFDPAPQPDALFETPTHNEALAGLVYGILEAKGFIALVGEVGVGKTTVLRRALQYVRAADPALLIVEIANPALAPGALATRIERALQLDAAVVSHGDLEPLETALRRLAAAGRRLLLVIDEAQSVSGPTLELLRILSNLDCSGRPLVQTVLSGQPEFDALLAHPAQRALRQRIAVRAAIRPLTRRQVVAYLRFRLQAAGAPAAGVMRWRALQRNAAASRGFPRRANIIADNALIAGFGAGRRPIGWRAVGQALAAIDAGAPRRLGFRLAWGSAAAILAIAALGWIGLPTAPTRDPGGVASTIQAAAR
ncbi:MAG: AAA family ATPase [Proteobacteria bacterium]|nr:AAA family ATPase [Pseudomonadota bacterium]